MQAQALFEEHLEWAASVGQSVGRHLPPSFDVQDLIQIALIQHWRCVENFDATPGHGYTCGVPYRLYAYPAIRGAVLMSCRRRHYREATHQSLTAYSVTRAMELRSGRHAGPIQTDVLPNERIYDPVDERARPDEMLLAREKQRNSTGPREWRQRKRILDSLARLGPADAYLLRRVFLDGAEAAALARAWQMDEKAFARLVGAAVRRLRRLVRNGTPAATAPRSRPLASTPEPELRTPSHRRAVLGWQPLRPPLRPPTPTAAFSDC
jgi:RNA polymerase sigma factor (sigma-70 family)